jgi:hypothetical protein
MASDFGTYWHPNEVVGLPILAANKEVHSMEAMGLIEMPSQSSRSHPMTLPD